MQQKTASVTVIYGNSPEYMTKKLLHAVNPAQYFPHDASIILKPNLVTAKPSASGATTTPGIVETVIRYLKDHGCSRISIMESSWIGCTTKQAFRTCGYDKLAKAFGVKLIDLKDDQTVVHRREGRDYLICRSVLEADILINMPVLKGHCQTRMTGALKNLKGCIPDSEKRRYHTLGLHEPIAQLNTIIKPAWTIMDALCGDLGFEEGGTPSSMHRILASSDPVLLDSYACSLLGLEPRQVRYIERAAELGVGKIFDPSAMGAVSELNMPDADHLVETTVRDMTHLTDERSACSACTAALAGALDCLDEQEYEDLLRLHQGYSSLFALGQDFADSQPLSTRNAIGIGTCCSSGFSTSVPGCPPDQDDILEAIRRYIREHTVADDARQQ